MASALPSDRITVWRNARLSTMAGRATDVVSNGALATSNGRIVFAGLEADMPAELMRGAEIVDCGGRLVTPGLIDCHTHIVHAGNRSEEFEARLNGASYEEIAKRGGGIMSTVRATRAASEEALLEASLPRVRRLLAEGVTTLEIKSGYGLDLDTERKMLRVARRLGATLPVRVKTTFLGAHALAPEYAGEPDRYVETVCE